MKLHKIFIILGFVCVYLSHSKDWPRTKIRLAHFQIVLDFVKELKYDSDSMYDFVAKIQAIFCPDQPICASDGIRERSDVLATLPGAINVTSGVVRLEEISEFVGICCLPCSCETLCHENENCCPTKYLLTNESRQVMLFYLFFLVSLGGEMLV